MTSGGQPVPEQIAAAIEASDHPELSIREVMERTDLSKGQVVSTAGSMDRLELNRSLGVVRLREDDGGEFVDYHEDELLPDGGHCAGGIDRCSYPDCKNWNWPGTDACTEHDTLLSVLENEFARSIQPGNERFAGGDG